MGKGNRDDKIIIIGDIISKTCRICENLQEDISSGSDDDSYDYSYDCLMCGVTKNTVGLDTECHIPENFKLMFNLTEDEE